MSELTKRIESLYSKVERLETKRIQAIKWGDQPSARSIAKAIKALNSQINRLEAQQ